ncbi:molybdate ABC transporter substrate-binding protein [Mesorhizobium sp. ES1-1]|uniref:molybdate ABC transporter substrate-binding protein n=1 Tax=Mesorhizobium sp. ES1-1 TaxID=2876629 RepID=UPI001CC99C3F|nr:molybdate ABC transporter substrate-binding protein [Mesorhizobium sp. ES1-1]MBZ9675916.1 molybdate ABC transporter substrate-binding protein [Mesorhizobium sp. ES1-1]
MFRREFGLRAIAMGGLAATLMSAVPAAHAEGKVVVFAAASLKDALDAVNKTCEADVGEAATVSYAASSALAKQIESGAPADVFISADLDWMKYLSDRKLTKPDTEVKLLGNEIVLVAPKDSTVETKIESGFDLARLVGDGKLAMGDVKAVPAGKYGKAALESLGVWSSVEGKVAQAENVRAALKLVSTGEAALGIVYATDANADKTVKVVGTFPEASHPPIIYPVAQTADSKDKHAAALLKCLQTAKAGALFKEYGFTVLAPSN